MIDQNLLNSMITELRRGTLTLAVLSSLKEPRYGYALLRSLEERGVQIEANTLYPLLRRLEAQGFLENTWDTSAARPRKYYVLSKTGQEIYRALVAEWQRATEALNALLEEEPS
jgi:DNA-binding PadR family transcriptional regulator